MDCDSSPEPTDSRDNESWDDTEQESMDDSEGGRSEEEDHIVTLTALCCDYSNPFVISASATYANLLNTQEPGLRILECEYAPRPFWKFAKKESQIPKRTKVLHFVDRSHQFVSSHQFVLATVRTPEDDHPIFITIDPQKDGTLSIEQLIEPYMQKEQLTPTIITTFSDQTDIRNKIFRYSDYKNEPTFPTVLFIDTDHDPVFELRTSTSKEIPPSIQTTLIQSEKLIKRAMNFDPFPLQAMHLARSVIHLIVSLIDGVDKLTAEEQFKEVTDLRSVLITTNSLITGLAPVSGNKSVYNSIQRGLDHQFLKLCDDRMGAVAIRRSHPAFLQLGSIDWKALNTRFQRAAPNGDNRNRGVPSAPSLPMRQSQRSVNSSQMDQDEDELGEYKQAEDIGPLHDAAY